VIVKKALIATLVMFSGIALADPVYLACSGEVMVNVTNKSYSDMNKKDKDFMRFNIIVDISDRSMVIGDSRYSVKSKYPDLFIADSIYSLSYHWTKPSKEYAYNSTYMSIDRYTGDFKYEYDTLTSEGNLKVNYKANGTCQIGVQWQSKF
jgi:hypothetical protein